MDIRPCQVLPSHDEIPLEVPPQTLYQELPSFQIRKPLNLAPSGYEVPTQMSPFGDDRWALDEEENRRRKEIHREYVYNYRKPMHVQPQPQQPILVRPEEPPPVPTPPRTFREEPLEVERPPAEPVKKDYFKREPLIPKPKTLADLQFDTPKPANLYPVLKFPERKFSPEPASWDIPTFEKTGVSHYGVHVPFWPFN